MKIVLSAFADEAGSRLFDQIEALRKNGIPFLEIRNVDGSGVADLSVEQAQNIKRALSVEGIGISSLGSPIGKVNVSDDYDAHIAKFEKALLLCKIFGCKMMRIFSFYTKTLEQDRDEIIQRLCVMVKKAEKENILLCLENEKELYGDTIDRVQDLLENVPKLGYVFDPANFVQCGQDIEKAIEILLPRATYVHIKDVDRVSGEMVPPGQGDCMIEKIVRSLNKDTFMTVEPHLMMFDGYSKIDPTVMKTRFSYPSLRSSFSAACNALKTILKEAGYSEKNRVWDNQGNKKKETWQNKEIHYGNDVPLVW